MHHWYYLCFHRSVVAREAIDTAPFDHARDYFRLFLKTEDDLLSFVNDYPTAFTSEELYTLWDIEGPRRKASEAGRQALTELLHGIAERTAEDHVERGSDEKTDE